MGGSPSACVDRGARQLDSGARDRRHPASGGPRRRIPEGTLCALALAHRLPADARRGRPPDTHRFRDPAWEEPPGELPGWWPGREAAPLVYMTFGSVAGSFPQALPVYAWRCRGGGPGGASAADCRPRARPRRAAAAPDNVRVEPWVPQQDVLAHAAAAVVHGGSGSTLGALAAGVPLVVVPLFADQPQNARRVRRGGCGRRGRAQPGGRPATARPLGTPSEPCSATRRSGSAPGRWPTSCAHSRTVDEVLPLFESFERS